MKEEIKTEVKEEKNEAESHTSVKEEPPDDEAGKFVFGVKKRSGRHLLQNIQLRDPSYVLLAKHTGL